MAKIDFIIPTYNQERHTLQCLKSLRRSVGRHDVRPVWVDNGSTPESRTAVAWRFNTFPNGLPIWTGQNLGFVKAVNLGLRACLEHADRQAEYIVVANNDIVLTRGFLDPMVKALRQEDIGAVGPVTSNRHGSPQWWHHAYTRSGHEAVPARFGDLDFDGKADYVRKRYEGALFEVPMLAFFCTAFKAEVFRRVGLLDENFGTGLGDDDDFCQRLRDHAYRIVIALDSYVVHAHRTTFKAMFSGQEIHDMQERAKNILRQKHPNTFQEQR